MRSFWRELSSGQYDVMLWFSAMVMTVALGTFILVSGAIGSMGQDQITLVNTSDRLYWESPPEQSCWLSMTDYPEEHAGSTTWRYSGESGSWSADLDLGGYGAYIFNIRCGMNETSVTVEYMAEL